MVGTPRAVSHQFGDSNATAAALRSRKRKSTRSAFAPVMEEDKDLDAEKVIDQKKKKKRIDERLRIMSTLANFQLMAKRNV